MTTQIQTPLRAGPVERRACCGETVDYRVTIKTAAPNSTLEIVVSSQFPSEAKETAAAIVAMSEDAKRLDLLEQWLIDDGRWRCAAFSRPDATRQPDRPIETELERCGHPVTGGYANVRTYEAETVRQAIDKAALAAGGGKNL